MLGVGWQRRFVVCEDKTVSLFPSEFNRGEHEVEAVVHLTHDTVVEVDVQPDPKSTVERCFGIRDGLANRKGSIAQVDAQVDGRLRWCRATQAGTCKYGLGRLDGLLDSFRREFRKLDGR